MCLITSDNTRTYKNRTFLLKKCFTRYWGYAIVRTVKGTTPTKIINQIIIMKLKTASRFKKGQIVYQVCLNVTTRIESGGTAAQLGMVIARQIDACGKVQMTFVDRGSDYTFGRRFSVNTKRVWATPEQAFAMLHRHKDSVDLNRVEGANDYENKVFVIHPTVESDGERKWAEVATLFRCE